MLDDFLRSPALPVMTFLFGLVAGHWLTIHRDRRKEYNELVTPLRQKIGPETRGLVPGRPFISRHDADAIGARMNAFSRHKFIKACERYWQAEKQQYQDELGQPLYRNQDAVRQAVQQLIDKIPLR